MNFLLCSKLTKLIRFMINMSVCIITIDILLACWVGQLFIHSSAKYGFENWVFFLFDFCSQGKIIDLFMYFRSGLLCQRWMCKPLISSLILLAPTLNSWTHMCLGEMGKWKTQNLLMHWLKPKAMVLDAYAPTFFYLNAIHLYLIILYYTIIYVLISLFICGI